jgi:5-methylcytosine-specific restriction endonuclease McrA
MGAAVLSPERLHQLAVQAFRIGNRGRLSLCEALRLLAETRLYFDLGFPSLAAYADAFFQLRRSETFEHVRVSKALLQLPRLRDAFVRGRIGWSALKAITRIATPETETAWLDFAARHGVEQTLAEARDAARKRRDAPRDGSWGLPNLEQKLVLRFPRSEMDKVLRWLDGQREAVAEATGSDEVSPEQAILFLCEKQALEGSGPGEAQGRCSEAAEAAEAAGAAGAAEAAGAAGATSATGTPEGTDMAPMKGSGPKGSGSANRFGRRTVRAAARASIAYQCCPDCRRARMQTRDGFVEVDRAEAERYEGSAETVVLDGPTPPRLRRRVLAREGGRCANPRCHHAADHCHHIVFRSRGGRTEEANEVAVCTTCHALVHAGLLRVQGNAEQQLHWLPAAEGASLEHRVAGDGAVAAELPVLRLVAERPTAEAQRASLEGSTASAESAIADSSSDVVHRTFPQRAGGAMGRWSAFADSRWSAAHGANPVGRAGSTTPKSANADSGADGTESGTAGRLRKPSELAQGLIRLGVPAARSRQLIDAAIASLPPGEVSNAQVLRRALRAI